MNWIKFQEIDFLHCTNYSAISQENNAISQKHVFIFREETFRRSPSRRLCTQTAPAPELEQHFKLRTTVRNHTGFYSKLFEMKIFQIFDAKAGGGAYVSYMRKEGYRLYFHCH